MPFGGGRDSVFGGGRGGVFGGRLGRYAGGGTGAPGAPPATMSGSLQDWDWSEAPSSDAWREYWQGRVGPIGLPAALAMMPGDQAFFDSLMGRAGRGLEATASAQRTALFNALESRGLGQSSVVGMGLANIGRQQGLGMQEAAANIAQQQFSMREQRVRDAMQYERERALLRLQKDLNKKPWWQSALDAVSGGAAAYFGLKGTGGSSGGSYAQGQIDAGNTGWLSFVR